MNDPRIEANLLYALRLGWTPADFGALEFDAELLERVEAFQRDRFLSPTGIADQRTHEALLSYRQGLADVEPDAERRESLRQLGSVSRYAPDDPRVVRSAAFAGRIGWAIARPSSDALALARAHVRGGADAVVVPAEYALTIAAAVSARVLGMLPLTLERPWSDGRAAATAISRWVVAGRGNVPAGLVVTVPDLLGALDECSTALIDFCDALEGVPLPRALAGVFPAQLASANAKRGLSGASRFDAALPFVPGAYRASAPESACGLTSAVWSIYGRMRPSFTFPVYHHRGEPARENFVHRVRAWCRDRGMRGIGLFDPMQDEQVARAFWGELPDVIPRVDR